VRIASIVNYNYYYALNFPTTVELVVARTGIIVLLQALRLPPSTPPGWDVPALPDGAPT